MIITFCGHSDFTSDNRLLQITLKILEDCASGKAVDFYLGGYGGFDSFAYDCAKSFAKNHKKAKLIYITPYFS